MTDDSTGDGADHRAGHFLVDVLLLRLLRG
jgi:hypothetical protein